MNQRPIPKAVLDETLPVNAGDRFSTQTRLARNPAQVIQAFRSFSFARIITHVGVEKLTNTQESSRGRGGVLKGKMYSLAFASLLFQNLEGHSAPIVQVGDIARAQIANDACVTFNRRHDTVGNSLFTPPQKPSNGDKSQTTTPKSPDSGRKSLTRQSEYLVKRGDTLQITLSQALVAEFPEPALLGRKRGDIAIVASVRERGVGDDFNFNAGSENTGRVVFFQRNVAPEAPLNLANLPIYGPATYTGKPLMVTLHIIEVDEASGTAASSLVDTLANLAKTVTPVNAAAISVLNSLGGALLRSNKNDIIAEYRAEFLPGEAEHQAVKTMALEYGNYAFVVSKTPGDWHIWNNYLFDQRNARIFTGTPERGSCGGALKDHTWLTFQVNRGLENAPLPLTSTFSALMGSITTEAQDRVKLLDTAKRELETSQKQRKNFRHYLNFVTNLRARSKNLDDVTIAELHSLIDKIQSSINKPDSDPPFDQIQLERLISELKLLISGSEEHLFSADKFDAVKVKGFVTSRKQTVSPP